MKKPVAALVALAGAIGIAAAAVPSASAIVTVSGPEVKYVFCSDSRNGNHVTYRDYNGIQSQGPVSFSDNIGGNRWCGSITVSADRDGFADATINNANSTYVYGAIYNIWYPPFSGSTGAPADVRLVAQKESYQSFGGYNYALVGY
ncbi:hypothetical protein [Prescottella agglutinans]|uniref:Uncharacterized protein n=1 Tax=Prescottella agglutinans TaxID=1644129 RepID=A0ABT6M4X5_9NOCA|nr:hypothetical protein [Prescottella agglutinans]MDH6279367.1 hypothetical protein [Prescottella agglutinans]